jgi:hypothetical protein
MVCNFDLRTSKVLLLHFLVCNLAISETKETLDYLAKDLALPRFEPFCFTTIELHRPTKILPPMCQGCAFRNFKHHLTGLVVLSIFD